MVENLCKIVNHYGVDKQINIWIEEMSELTKELCKYKRGSCNIDNLKKEITDVQICLDQMKLAFKYTAQEQKCNYDFKISRQLIRMDDENE